jgi:hypothetical protein
MAKIKTLPPATKSERRQAQKKFGKELGVLNKEISKRSTSDGFMPQKKAEQTATKAVSKVKQRTAQ